MNRRTILKRMGATAAVGVGLTGTASGSGGGPAAAGTRVDVSGVSGKVPLTDLVEDPESTFADDAFGETDLADVRIVVEESTDEVTLQDIKCELGCCCSRRRCSEECDVCYCTDCGGPSCEPKVA